MYTKRPWKRAGKGNLIYASTKTQHGNVNRFSITVTAPKGIEGTAPPEELEANVQLILACPDMYEALKETAIILETMVDAGMIGKGLKVCSLVEQALAKAEGRA